MTLDNFRTIELIWDKANKSIIKTIKTASSDTTGRYLSVKVLDGGQEVTLSGAKLQLYWEHPNFNTSGTDDFNAVNDGGLFNMTFSDEMLTNIGELNAHLVLTLSDGKITSDGFTIEVIKGTLRGVVIPSNGDSAAIKALQEATDKLALIEAGAGVAIIEDGSITTPKIADAAVAAEKLSDEYNARIPWITEGSLNNVYKSGAYLVSGTVEQNPLKNVSFLSVEATATTNLDGLVWVKQTITSVDENGEQYHRVLQYHKSDRSVRFIRNWIKADDLRPLEQELDKLENVEILPLVETTKIANGLYSSSGNFVTNDGYDSYRFDVEYKTDYRHNRGNPLTVVAFDQNSNFVKSYSTSGNFKIDDRSISHVFIPVKRGEPFVVSKGTKKVEYTTENGFYANGKQIGEWSGKKWIALGTSMTMVANSYFKYVENRLGLIGENRGRSGGGITASASAGNTTMQEIENLEDFNGLLTIEVGPNDGGHPLGELGDTTADTFYGCLYQAFSKAQQKTTARIVVLTTASQWADTRTQNRRDVVQQWTQFTVTRQHTRKAIMDMATWFSLPVIDVQGESGIGGWVQNSQTTYDHIHPTKLGGDMIGMYIAKQIDSRIQPFPDELMLATDRDI